MTIESLRSQLIHEGLDETSVDRLIDHYQKMRFHLGSRNYIEAGAHVGNFCENLANVILSKTPEGVDPHVDVGTFIDNITNSNIDASDLDYEIRVLIPRAMRVAYDLRNNRDSVHVNLEVPVNHSDTQTAVRLCSWMLTELVRVYADEDDMDEIARLIEEFASPNTPYIDGYAEKRIIMSRDLDVREEILVHLFAAGMEVDADDLTEWIPNANSHAVRSKLGNLKQARKIHYEDGKAKITPLGMEDAEAIIDEHFESGIEELSH